MRLEDTSSPRFDGQRRALQVYLDSSDFSVLADRARRTPELEEVERQLLAWQSEGRIELRFSYAHVVEAAPIKQEDLEPARRRLLHIKRLCGLRCLTNPFTILERELRQLACGCKGMVADDLYRDNGDWIPELGEDFLQIPSPAAIYLKELDDMHLSREERRKAERKYLRRDGRLRPAAFADLGKALPGALAELAERYPLSPQAFVDIGRYLKGTGSRDKAQQGIKASFADLESFSNWYEKQWDKVSSTSAWLRETGLGLSDSLAKSASDARELYARQVSEGLAPDVVESLARDAFKSLSSQMPRNLASRLAKDMNDVELPPRFECSWTLAPSLLAAVTAAAHVGRQTAMLPKSNRVPRRSDFGDIVHTFYLPFVDVFRADGFIANAISEAKMPIATTVVAKLRDLPASIQHRLSTRRPI